jgi:hypothetical protein
MDNGKPMLPQRLALLLCGDEDADVSESSTGAAATSCNNCSVVTMANTAILAGGCKAEARD